MEDLTKYKLVCVLGPTASGKTNYAVQVARALGGEILSADSRQVYKGMDIGTGKDKDSYGDIPCHLIDLVPAGSKYDIHRYQQDFATAYHLVTGRGALPILCGGSGLYIEAVTQGYALPSAPANPVLRAQWEQESTEVLVARLAALKPLHNTTDYDTRQRLIRALEIATYLADHPQEPSTPQLPLFEPGQVKYIGLQVSREERNRRIDRRLKERLQQGMVQEVKDLLDSGIPAEDLIYYGLEYKFVTYYLTGRLSYDQMEAQLAIAIHQFAKRQMTWFRGMERRGIQIEWVSLSEAIHCAGS